MQNLQFDEETGEKGMVPILEKRNGLDHQR